MNKTLASVLHSATALTLLSIAQPAEALPPGWPPSGLPPANINPTIRVLVTYCDINGGSGMVGVVGQNYDNGKSYGPFVFDSCVQPTDYTSCMNIFQQYYSDAQAVAMWFTNNKYTNVSVGQGDTLPNPWCSSSFPGGSSGTQWRITNLSIGSSTYLALQEYTQDTGWNTLQQTLFTNLSSCEQAAESLTNYFNTRYRGTLQDDYACPAG